MILHPTTLGEHLRKRRLEAGQLQQAAAEQLNVSVETLIGWEKDRHQPEARHWPQIMAFLGYDPHPIPYNLGERIRAAYRKAGLSRKEASRRLGLDENTLQRYELGQKMPSAGRVHDAISEFLSASGAN